MRKLDPDQYLDYI